MRVREYRPSDEEKLKELYDKQCLPYDWPDINEPEFVVRLVVVDENDTPVVAGIARRTVELYGLFDGSWENPAWRFEALCKLHEAMRHELGKHGYTDACAWIPPSLMKSFGRKLKKVFGWQDANWTCLTRKTGY